MTAGGLTDPRAPQLRASNPGVSAWVSANAGSGKTRVLIERVARILLSGAKPQRILCLTYTNAAAAEMQNRLFDRLGAWAMMEDGPLSDELRELTRSNAGFAAEDLARARRLFAQALETPGGLKIQTIHAFCATILRRFPLEAGVAPRFEVLDERARTDALAEARDATIARAVSGDDQALSAAFRLLTDHLSDDALDAALTEAATHRRLFLTAGALESAQNALGVAEGADWRREVTSWRDVLDRAALERAVGIMAKGGATDTAHADRIASLYESDDECAVLAAARGAFLIQSGAPRKLNRTPTKDIDADEPWIRALLKDAQDGFLTALERVNAIQRADLTAALHQMASAALVAFADIKASLGALDFDDIIERTLALLQHSETAAWVLYKLDGGLDHILVDEAQDTSPDQWRVIEALAQEFHAGIGAADAERSLFVVGDEKQSIYSFQGADPREFTRMRSRFGARQKAIGRPLEEPKLLTSFRSARAILRVVDLMLQDPAAPDGAIGDLAMHQANRDSLKEPGRVDLWPVLPKGEAQEEPPWWRPVDAPPRDDPELRLAEALAGEIERMLRDGDVIPGKGRAVTPGDIMVLVRRRGKLAKAILRDLQARGVPVAGADRLKIAEHIAVKDLLALAKVALLPEDSLSLAAVLRSPLCGLSEEDLFDQAYDRGGKCLWDRVIVSTKHGETAKFLKDTAAQADFKRPYEFLQHILIRHDGRRNLIARLGREAEDAIDELLAQALAYERAETPSLQGFVEWIEAGDPEIKREQQPREKGDPGLVRVMTVHGAKGLESPIVILPDTLAPGGSRRPQVLVAGEAAIAAGAARDDPPAAAEARADAERRDEEERLRLLYVAMTRAEDWLIVCAAGDPDRAENGWHGLVRRAMAGDTNEFETPLSSLGCGPGLRVEDPAAASATFSLAAPGGAPAPPERIPEWLSAPLPAEPARDRPVSPSDLGGAHAVDVESGSHPGSAAGAREKAMRRGDLIHKALELAADVADEARERLIERVIGGGAAEFDPDERRQMAEEVRRVLREPDLAPIFAREALVEPALWATPPELGGRRLDARLDRLIISRDAKGAVSARIIDFKTNRPAPTRPEDTPEAYLRQLGAYRAAVAQIYPGAMIETAILWTADARLMTIPATLTSPALTRAIAELGD